MGLFPPLWGDSYWMLMHTNAQRVDAYWNSEDTKWHDKAEKVLQWFDTLCSGILCDYCEIHCDSQLPEMPMPRSKAEGSMFEWTVKFHNAVNVRTGKREVSVVEAEALLKKHMGATAVEELSRAQEVRREDHAKIKRLVAELERLGYADPDAEPQQKKMWSMKVAAFMVGVIVTAVFLVLLWLLAQFFLRRSQ